MIEKLIASPLTYIALLIIGLAIYGLLSKRIPEKFRNGVYIPIVLGIGLLLLVVVMPGRERREIELVTGEFTVPAYQSKGIPYVNYMSFPIAVDFISDGQWSTAKQYQSLIGPEGLESNKPADGRYRLPEAPIGALIMQWKSTSQYELVGSRKTLKLEPKEEVIFMINDYKTDKAYSDNYGEIKIRWTCQNCRG
ncbi:MAG: hypothetical protein JXA04_11495 [Gammaproteobacteria bacterium]|nr:hypothetical protein [Gammaproteobacteria bacterium]